MNLKQIRSIVKRNTKADTMNMPDASINLFINLAQKEIVRQTLCLKAKATVSTNGGTGGSITDYSGTVAGTILISQSAITGLTTGDEVIIFGDYFGTYSITTVSTKSFYVTATYVANESNVVWSRQEYDLPSDFHKSMQMKIDSTFPKYVQEEYTNRLFTTTPETGTAYYFYIDREADKYGIYPVPTGVNTGVFYYRSLPATLSSDTDTPDIPTPYHDAIVYGASYRVAEQLNNADMRNEFFALFKTLMADMANDLATRQSDPEPQIVQSQDILDA